jgi:hypothetical protein
MKMEQFSETSAYTIQNPENYQEENIQNTYSVSNPQTFSFILALHHPPFSSLELIFPIAFKVERAVEPSGPEKRRKIFRSKTGGSQNYFAMDCLGL